MNRRESYRANREWSDGILAEVQGAVGHWLGAPAVVAPPMLDMRENTDLVVLNSAKSTIACRTRRHSYFARYPYQFTIRTKCGGCKTEIHKLLDGFGDYIFYAFTDSSDKHLHSAFLGDLGAFRRWYMPHYGERHTNKDGTALAAYDRRYIPGFVIHEYTKPGAPQ